MREKMDHEARKKLERSVKESENALKTRDEKLDRLRVRDFNFDRFFDFLKEINGRLREVEQFAGELKKKTKQKRLVPIYA